MKEKSSIKDERTRNWMFVVYPDSAPNNWIEILDELQIPAVISPIHDKDIDGDGEPKKPHYHVALIFEGKKSFAQILEITNLFNSPIPKRIISLVGTIRYFCHLDTPIKAQYSISDMVALGGADLMAYLKPTSSSRYQFFEEMIDWVDENKCKELKTLVRYAKNMRRDDWFPLLIDSTFFMDKYIKSCRHAPTKIEKQNFDDVLEVVTNEK